MRSGTQSQIEDVLIELLRQVSAGKNCYGTDESN